MINASSSLIDYERNIRLFTVYKSATSVLPWLPIFSLFFLERVSLGDAILLSSVYYLCVFLLEVPSGYVSDRFGRRMTLLCSSLMTLIACVIFLLADSFAVLAVAQCFLAAGIAFQSGSDSALLYDSLCVLNRENEYAELESTVQKWSMLAMAGSCLTGGVVGMVDLRLAYVLSLAAAGLAAFLCYQFVEPPLDNDNRAAGFVDQLGKTLRYFAHPLLAWILGFSIIGFCLEHVPFEFYQPYLKLLDDNVLSQWLMDNSAPLVSGVVISISMFGGALGAAISERLIRRLGDAFNPRMLFLASVAIQIIIVGGLSLILHPLVLVLVMFRNFAMSMARGPMLGAVAPEVHSAQRATFLSLLSLAGRASFGVILWVLSTFVIGPEQLGWETLSAVLRLSALVGIVALAVLYLWSIRIRFLSHQT